MGTKAEEKKTTELKDSEPKQIGHGTFIVDVKYRENATWQGKVIWAEKNKEQYFRSALELLKMMEDALDDANKDVSEQVKSESSEIVKI